LNLDIPTTCGDGFCLGSESSATCAADCGSPPVNPGGGGSGSGGGSGGGSGTTTQGAPASTTSQTPAVEGPVCVEQWECNYWNDCANGKQTRECKDLKNCGTTRVKPVESRDCVDETKPVTAAQTKTQESPSFFNKLWSSITGRSVDGSSTGVPFVWIVIGLVVLLILISVFVGVRNSRAKTQGQGAEVPANSESQVA
jgi:hypothetical protein